MAYDSSGKFKKSGPRREGGAPGGARFGGRPGGRMRRKVCRFCADKSEIDYKDVLMLRHFVSDRGKIINRRVTGVCARHQRILTQAIKRARIIALIPFASS